VFLKDKEVQAIVVDPDMMTGDIDMRNNTFPAGPSPFDKFKKP